MASINDIVIRAAADGLNVRDTRVSDVVTADVQSCRPTDAALREIPASGPTA